VNNGASVAGRSSSYSEKIYLTCRSVVRISSNAFASSGLLAIAIPSSVTFLEVEFILDKKFALLVINHIVFFNLRERFLLPLL